MTPHPDDTIVALSSAPGPGLRAIVRVSGPDTAAVVGKVFVPDGLPRGEDDRSVDPLVFASRQTGTRSITPGSLTLSGVHSPLPADLYFFRGPNTYTGQDLAEIHTISSPPLVERLIADLLAAGARAAQPGEFTLRAFLTGKKDLPQAEAVLAVIESDTDADLQQSLRQLAGGVTEPLSALRSDLLNLLADVEAALDFVDEDIEFVSKRDTLLRLTGALAHLTNLNRQLDGRTVSGRTLRVAIVGEPNAGKSSLFNALVGTPSALVSDVPGTTRDYLSAVIDLNGVKAEVVDTAGWQVATDDIENQAQYLGRTESSSADVIMWCVPASAPVGGSPPGDVILVRTKTDLVGVPSEEAGESVFVSVVGHPGVDRLRRVLSEKAEGFTRSPLAPSQARCRGHVTAAMAHLRTAHGHCVADDPPELLALALRAALDQIGEMAGAVYTNDLLDRIFSRFCIGK